MNATACFTAVSAEDRKPIRLAMQRLWLTGRLLPMGAHLTVQHVFRSEEEKPLEVVYAFSLPRDAALKAFRITGPGFEVHSELKPQEDAVKVYEDAIAKGNLASLARQHGDGLINLTAGNIRPGETVTVLLELMAGVELRDDGFRFRFPFTLAPNYHARMRSACISPGVGELELPQGEFGDVLLPAWRQDASDLHEVGFALTAPRGRKIRSVASPSHAITVQSNDDGPALISLAPERDVPDRDLVLDVEFREQAPHLFAGPMDDGRLAFAAIVPSTAFGKTQNAPRRVAILLDRSGSMQGVPIAQARKAIAACLAVLSEEDLFTLVAFDDRVDSMADALLAGTLENRFRAKQFLETIEARGGTQLANGFEAAAGILNGTGDVLILTDGQVAGTEEILSRARAMGIRLFCLGIGAASQDRFLTLLARESGGVSRFAAPNERVDVAALDLFASLGRPVATGLKAGGTVSIAPEPAGAVFAGAPVLVFGEAAQKDAVLELTWDSGKLSLPVPEGEPSIGKTLHLLQGSRLITDWESRYPAKEALATIEKRQQSRAAGRLRSLSETYGLASREMALVAVVKRADDAAGDLPLTRVVPVGMPQGMPVRAIFGGATRFTGFFSASSPRSPLPPARMAGGLRPGAAPPAAASGPDEFARMFSGVFNLQAEKKPDTPEDILMDLASQLEPDGGMPGKNIELRAARSIAVLYAMISQGHGPETGAFRLHVARLIEFLKSLNNLDAKEKRIVQRAIEAATTGRGPAGDWLNIAQRILVFWDVVAAEP
jgi:Ca-activated chloride channel family protein